jgi:hypothetical protein
MTAIGVTANGHHRRLSPMARRFARFSVDCCTSQPFWASSGLPAAGHLSDCVGRKRMYVIGRAYVGVFDFIYFALLDTQMPTLLALCFTSTYRTVQCRIDKS